MQMRQDDIATVLFATSLRHSYLNAVCWWQHHHSLWCLEIEPGQLCHRVCPRSQMRIGLVLWLIAQSVVLAIYLSVHTVQPFAEDRCSLDNKGWVQQVCVSICWSTLTLVNELKFAVFVDSVCLPDMVTSSAATAPSTRPRTMSVTMNACIKSSSTCSFRASAWLSSPRYRW